MLQFFPALVLLFWQAQFAHADLRGLPLASQLLFCSQSKDRIAGSDCLISVLIQKRDPNQTEPVLVPRIFSGQPVVNQLGATKTSVRSNYDEFLVVRSADRMRDGPAVG